MSDVDDGRFGRFGLVWLLFRLALKCVTTNLDMVV